MFIGEKALMRHADCANNIRPSDFVAHLSLATMLQHINRCYSLVTVKSLLATS